MVSILSDFDVQMNYYDNVLIRNNALLNNSYREESSIEDYFHNLTIYVQVMKIYVDFFTEFWYKDDVDQTNKMMTKELERIGLYGPNTYRIWSGLTEKENNPLGEYVLTLNLPVKDSDMKTFFKRVACGDLEFMCRYPYNNTDAFELIKGVIW